MRGGIKRILSGILALLMTGIVSSCTNEKEEIPTLVWYLPGKMQEDTGKVLECVNEITVSKIGAKLDIKFVDTDKYDDTMNMKMSVQEEFDLCFTGYTNPYRQAVMRGGLLKLNDYIENMPDLKNVIPDYAWNGAEIEGGIYAVPNMQFIAYCSALFVDRSLAEKYGLDKSKINKLTDMEPFFEWVKQNEPDYHPYSPSWGVSGLYEKKNSEFPMILLEEIVVEKTDEGSYRVIPSIESEYCRNAIYKTYEWYQKGYIRNDIAFVNEDKNTKKASYVGMYKPGAEGERLAFGEDYITIPLKEPMLQSRSGTTAMTGVGKWSRYPDKAIKLIELVNTDKELLNLLNFGIEEKHYTKIEENRIELVPKEQNTYFINCAWKFGNQFLAYILPGQADDVWEETQNLNDKAGVSEFIDFKVSTAGIEDEINRMETVYSQYEVINYGSRNPDEYLDEFSAKLHEAGVDKICQEVERQFMEYLKTKEE